nr:hypothetical protein CFP56_40223 [Quercus suber]
MLLGFWVCGSKWKSGFEMDLDSESCMVCSDEEEKAEMDENDKAHHLMIDLGGLKGRRKVAELQRRSVKGVAITAELSVRLWVHLSCALWIDLGRESGG